MKTQMVIFFDLFSAHFQLSITSIVVSFLLLVIDNTINTFCFTQ